MKYILLLVLGIILGGGAAIYFLGVPGAKAIPGTRVQAPDTGGDPPGTVVVSINNTFFDGLLNTVFRELSPPTFKLSSTQEPRFTEAAFQEGCANSVTLSAEGSNTKTQVQFTDGKVLAPLVFSGTYNLNGCTQFKGWAQTSIELSFDQPSQTLYGRLQVEGVNLENVNPIVNPFATVLVRTAIDTKVNPIKLLGQQQLQLLIPVQASGGSVKAVVKDVRSDVQDGNLRLHITYDFSGAKGQQPQG
jgi:hypothetical protein